MSYTIFGGEQLLDIFVDCPKLHEESALSFGGDMKASLNTTYIVQLNSKLVNTSWAGRSHLKYSAGEF